ncbi:MAG TPA: hypothetical protein VLT86_14935 [Vicinamibacterales bacterium]|nr:hypothetical protein [Vicinamibacterales bacterium]
MFAPLLMAGLVAVTLSARRTQEKIDDAMNAKIRAEGMDRSQATRAGSTSAQRQLGNAALMIGDR